MQSTAYWLGDAPAAPLALVPVRDGEPVDLEPYSAATALLALPDGTTVPATAALEDGELTVTLPELTQAGLAWLRVKLATEAGRSDRLDAVPVIVQTDDGWHTLGSARAEWRDAGSIDDRRLWVLLEVAKAEVLAYAPALLVTAPVPLNYRDAQLMHARNRLNAARVDPATGDNGGNGFALTPFPLDWAIKQTLRPQRGAKAIR